MSYQECAVHAGNLVTIRYISQDSSIEDWVQHFFPGAQDYKTSTSEATMFELISTTSWTFLEKVQPGEPSRHYTHYPPWLRFHDPYFVAQAFLEMMTQQQTGYDNYRVYVGQGLLGNQITFLCGEPRQHHCLIQVSFSAKWDDMWSETFCYQVKERQTTKEFLRSINVEGADIAIFREGRPFRDDVAHFRNGDLIEIEFEQCSDENGTTSGEDVQGQDDVSTMQQSHAVMSRHDEVKLSGRTCKPNPELGVDFDDELPFRRRVINDETIITRDVPPPNWAELPIYMVASSLQAVARDGAGHLFVYFRTWLLHHNQDSPVEPRDGRIRAQLMVNLRSHIRRRWREHIGPEDEIKTTVVRPNPVLDRNEGPMLLLLVECNRPLGSPTRPILLTFQEIDARGPEPERSWRAFLAPPTINLQYLADRCSCEPHHIIAPLGTEDRRWIGQGQSRPVVSGRYIPIWFDQRRPPFGRNEPVDGAGTLVEEDTSLMQKGGGREGSRSPRRTDRTTPTSTQSSSLHTLIHVYRISREHRVISLDRASSQPYVEQVKMQWAAPSHHGLTDLHIVQYPPHDLESTADETFIVEFASDRQRQADPADRLILVDIKIQEINPHETGSHIRRALWSRSFMSREDMLRLLSSAGLCKLTTIRCELEVNHNLWPLEDSVRRQMLHGDFVQLKVLGPQEVPASHIQIALCEQEAADSQRFVFHSSPTPSPEPTTPIEEGQEEPELESHEEEAISPGQSLSMIQRKVSLRKSLHQPFTDITNVPNGIGNQPEIPKVLETVRQADTVNSYDPPHVFDRWCDGSVEFTGSDCNPALPKPQEQESPDGKNPCSEERIGVDYCAEWDFEGVIRTFDSLDSNFTLPCYCLPESWTWKGPELQWLQAPLYSPDIPCHDLWIYTDGSAEEGVGGAAAVIYCNTPEGWMFGGALSLHLEQATSFTAEQWGTILAAKAIYDILKIHQLCHGFVPWCMIRFDSQAAGFTATGHWGVKGDPRLQKVVRSICHLIEQRFHIAVDGQHVAAHKGDPGNEFADNAAEQAREGTMLGSGPTGLRHLVDSTDIKTWEWLWFLCRTHPNSQWNGGHLEMTFPAQKNQQQEADQLLNMRCLNVINKEEKETTSFGILDVTLATANVLTLKAGMKEDPTGLQGTTRQHAVYKQLHAEGIHIAALQESRLRQKNSGSNPWYIIRQSEATNNGCYGIQLLFHRE